MKMSWFQSSGFADLAKNALSSAQKTIDRALDIHVENTTVPSSNLPINTPKDETENFFAAFGIGATSLNKSTKKIPSSEEKKAGMSGSLWGSFSGSFFEHQTQEDDVDNKEENKSKEIKFVSEEGGRVKIEQKPDNSNDTVKSDDVHSKSSLLQVKNVAESTGSDIAHEMTEDFSLKSQVNSDSVETDQSVIIQQPSSGKTKSINLISKPSETKSTDTKICLKNSETEKSLETELKLDHSKQKQSKTEPGTDKPVDQITEIKGEIIDGKYNKSNMAVNIVVEPNVVEILEKSTDSSETIKDEGENETLIIESCNEKTGGDSQDLPEIWEWESKSILTSENENSVTSVSVPVADLLHFESAFESTDASSEMNKGETEVQLQVENLEGSFVNVISNTGNDNDNDDNSLTSNSVSYLEMNKPQEETNNIEGFCDKKMEVISSEMQNTSIVHPKVEMSSAENKVTDSIISTASSNSNSYVTCMIEEAMGDQETQRSHSPHSTTSSSEKSDMVKMESEQNSGHTSGDEVETTTSSDIEILSMSSPNGDNLERLSLSPIKQIWIGKPNYGTHLRRTDRADSPSSDTSSVRDSPMSHRPRSDKKFIPILVPCTSKDGKNSSTKFQGSKRRTGNLSQQENQNEIDLGQKLSEMTEILKVRENKLVELSRENISLQEKNDTITKQLQQVEQAHAADARDVTTLTEEFSQRLATMERNLQNALKEKETLKEELHDANEELMNKVCAKEVEAMIKEKDTQIQELLQEGEKLSKQQLQHLNIIKKLRAKEKENENHIKQQKEKLEEQSNELERSRKALSAKEEIERKQIDAIRQLTNTVQKQEKEISNLKSDLEDSQEKVKSLKSVLDTSYKELAELHRSNIEKESQVQEVVISAEITAKEEVRLALEKAHNSALQEREALVTQIEDLRITLSRMEQQSNRKEDILRQEIADLQQRLQEAEVRNQELMQNTSAASRPLLRQIENLQTTFSSQSAAWEKIERNLTDRLNEAQMQLSIVTEKERASTERYMELNSRVSSLEAQNNLLRQEKTRLQAEIETKNVKLEMLDEWKTKESVQIEMLKQSFASEIEEMKRELKILEHQLDIEKTVVEAEKRKNLLLLDQLKEKEKRNSQLVNHSSNRTTPSPTSSLSKFSSVSDSFNLWIQDENIDQNIMTSSAHGNRLNLYDSLRHNGGTSFLEGLQSQLKMKEGEIVQLQNEILQLEKVRESMAQELVRLSSQNEDIEEELRQFHEQQSKFQDMEQKYNALLQMYGEKMEEADELRLDLQDVKEMYKAQINDLLNKK